MKDFETWHNFKCAIDAGRNAPPFHEREIWWCSIGINVGSEEDGRNDQFERPVLIIRKFNHETFWGVPLTSKIKIGTPYLALTVGGTVRTVLLQQARLYSSKRLTRQIDTISELAFEDVKRQLSEVLSLSEYTKPQ